MEWDVRTALRVVLVAGGVGYVVWGAIDGQLTLVAVGVLAAVVGLFGLYREGFGRPGA